MTSPIRIKNNKIVLSISGLLLLIITFASSSSDILGGLGGNILAFMAYILFIAMFAFIRRSISLPKAPILSLGIIYILFIFNSLRISIGSMDLPTSFALPSSSYQVFLHVGDLLGYILASFTLIFIVPLVLSKNDFFIVVTTVSTISIIVGIPAYFIGDYNFLFININTYTSLEPLNYYGIDIPALSSIWGDANAMSKITLGGIFGSHYLYHKRNQSKLWISLFILNLFGLMLANSRMAILALLIAYTIYAFSLIYDTNAVRNLLFVFAISGSIVFLTILLGVGTDVFVAKVGFMHRVELWRASVYTFSRHPITGVGIHSVGEIIAAYTSVGPVAPRNSYLRVLVAVGIIGGLTYIWLVVSTTFNYIKIIKTKSDMILFSLFLSFVLIQFTDTSDPFGINKNALIFGVTLGYLIKDIYSNNLLVAK